MISTDVIFRVKKNNDEVIAVFPEIPTEITGELCKGFSLVSKFIGVDYKLFITQSKSATPEEYEQTYDELLMLGYCLNVVQKNSIAYKKMRIERVKAELCNLEE